MSTELWADQGALNFRDLHFWTTSYYRGESG